VLTPAGPSTCQVRNRAVQNLQRDPNVYRIIFSSRWRAANVAEQSPRRCDGIPQSLPEIGVLSGPVGAARMEKLVDTHDRVRETIRHRLLLDLHAARAARRIRSRGNGGSKSEIFEQ